MCGRFAFYHPPSLVRQYLADWEMPVYSTPEDDEVRQTYNFAPGNFGLIYRADVPDYGAGPSRGDGAGDGSNEKDTPKKRATKSKDTETHYKLQSMKWGLIPFWTKKNPDYGTLMRTINCRDDSLAGTGGMWSSMKKRKRCIVICDGFFEWLKKNNGKEKIPHYIKRKDGKMMTFAGLWDVVNYDDTEEKNYTFTIITTDANKQMEFIHDRMPVILEPGSQDMFKWLDPEQYEWSNELQSLLKPYSGELQMYPVDKAVGKVGNNSESFVVPIDSTENKKNIVNFFNKQAEKNKSPKKTPVTQEESEPVKEEEEAKNVESPPPSTSESKTDNKRSHEEISDHEDLKPARKIAKKSEIESTLAKSTRKMHSATSNGTVPKTTESPKKADKSKKITTFFAKNSA